jgi:hypothetical protein
MTRYEMAQIVAKAMAKGANVNKLAAEFADELDALGVRVAALEKKSDNVKITGTVQYRWWMGSRIDGQQTKNRVHRLRTDINFNGKINDGWDYFGRIRNEQFFHDDVGNEAPRFIHAFVTGRVGGVKVEAGRKSVDLIGGDSDVYSDRVDHLKLTYGDKFKISGWYGKPTAMNGWDLTGRAVAVANGNYSKFAGVRLSYDWDKWGVYAEYDKFAQANRGMNNQNANTRDIFGIGVDGKMGDFSLNALYLHGKIKNVQDQNKNGFTVQLGYKGADKSKPGSWGVHVKYYDQGDTTYIAHGFDAMSAFAQPGGFKGWKLGVDYAVAKNMVANLWYYDLKGKNLGNLQGNKERTILAQMVFSF